MSTSNDNTEECAIHDIKIRVYTRAPEGKNPPSKQDVENKICDLILAMPRIDNGSEWDVIATSLLPDDKQTPVIKACEAILSPLIGKEGFWLSVGKASIYIKDRDDNISIAVYPIDHESEESVLETCVLHSELETDV
jgi:hypothetical protein